MKLTTAIQDYNKSSHRKIKLSPTRDGRVTAKLPLVGRQILAEGSSFNKEVVVTGTDVAWLCEEARRSLAPGMALLEASLAQLGKSLK